MEDMLNTHKLHQKSSAARSQPFRVGNVEPSAQSMGKIACRLQLTALFQGFIQSIPVSGLTYAEIISNSSKITKEIQAITTYALEYIRFSIVSSNRIGLTEQSQYAFKARKSLSCDLQGQWIKPNCMAGLGPVGDHEKGGPEKFLCEPLVRGLRLKPIVWAISVKVVRTAFWLGNEHLNDSWHGVRSYSQLYHQLSKEFSWHRRVALHT